MHRNLRYIFICNRTPARGKAVNRRLSPRPTIVRRRQKTALGLTNSYLASCPFTCKHALHSEQTSSPPCVFVCVKLASNILRGTLYALNACVSLARQTFSSLGTGERKRLRVYLEHTQRGCYPHAGCSAPTHTELWKHYALPPSRSHGGLTTVSIHYAALCCKINLSTCLNEEHIQHIIAA